MANRQAAYTISVVANLLGVHPQTLRGYEREGLVRPSRSRGNTRLYSQQDVERLRLILSLTRDRGVNIAGVALILELGDQIERMQREARELIRLLGSRFNVDPEYLAGYTKGTSFERPLPDLIGSRS